MVLADEPTGALDSNSSEMLLEVFRRMKEMLGATILLVTHDIDAACYADRILFLKDGCIVKELCDQKAGREVYRGAIYNQMAIMGGRHDVS